MRIHKRQLVDLSGTWWTMRSLSLLALVALVRGNNVHRYVHMNDLEKLEAEILGKRSTELNAVEAHTGQTPLFKAVSEKKTTAVKMLLKAGADATIGDKDGYTVCHEAARLGHHEILLMLLEKGLPCTTDYHTDGFTPLHRACTGKSEAHTAAVRALIKAGAPADQKAKNGMSPMELAVDNAATRGLLKTRLKKVEMSKQYKAEL